MTRWGFISDVHGNLPALERTVEACHVAGTTALVYLGDLLGPGDSDGCVRIVRETATLSVLGNRDLDWADRVSPGAREYILGLPRWAEAGDFVIAHGDARLEPRLSTQDLRRGFGRTYGWLQSLRKRVGFFGHSHHARVWSKSAEDAAPELLTTGRLDLSEASGLIYLVNVGSAGLPFPGKGPASCVVYDDRDRWLHYLVTGPGRGRSAASAGRDDHS